MEAKIMKWDEHSNGIDVLSPFTYQCVISSYQYVKMIILSVILLPIRAVLALFMLLITLGVSNLIAIDYEFNDQLNPLCSFRRQVLLPVMIVCARLVFFLAGFQWINVSGRRATRDEAPVIVVAPHSSYLDSLIVVMLGLPSVVAKLESAQSIIGSFVTVLQPILVNRENPDSRRNTMRQIAYRAKSSDDWPQVLIFPEGTCTNRSCLASFKQGAFAPGVPVQPVVVRWPNTVDCVTWVCEGPSVLKLLWMALTQFHNRLEIEFLPVYYPTEDERISPQLYANNVRLKMAKALDIPLCDLSYDDFCRTRIACRVGLPMPQAQVYLNSLLRSQGCFSQISNVCLPKQQAEQTSFRERLDHLLNVAQNHKYLTRIAFVDEIFPNKRPNEKEILLINLVMKHYKNEVTAEVNFQLFMIHVCMFLFADKPSDALFYASKVFPDMSTNVLSLNYTCHYGSPNQWFLNREDARVLLRAAFQPIAPSQLEKVLEQASTLTVEELSPNWILPTSSEVLGTNIYEALCIEVPNLISCYESFNAELRKILGSTGRPLVESASASETNLSSLAALDILVEESTSGSGPDSDGNSERDSLLDSKIDNTIFCSGWKSSEDRIALATQRKCVPCL